MVVPAYLVDDNAGGTLPNDTLDFFPLFLEGHLKKIPNYPNVRNND